VKRTYRYVGPSEIREKVAGAPPGTPILLPYDAASWVEATGQAPDQHGLIRATFTVSPEGVLHVADRHSEHVACAAGGVVLSAGEIAFDIIERATEVVEITNQSTGYCPEPESWPAVADALDRVPLRHPGRFSSEFVFRRCPDCGQRNVVKEGDFTCSLCGAELPEGWNF
jgi:hypothetical protein